MRLTFYSQNFKTYEINKLYNHNNVCTYKTFCIVNYSIDSNPISYTQQNLNFFKKNIAPSPKAKYYTNSVSTSNTVAEIIKKKKSKKTIIRHNNQYRINTIKYLEKNYFIGGKDIDTL